MPTTAEDLRHLREATDLAARAARRGNRPFGAVIVGADGVLLAAAENSTATDDDITAHAEINAIRAVCRGEGQARLAGATIYASGEPCPMCTGAIIRFGLCRVVFSQSGSEAAPVLGPQAAGIHVAVGAITALAPHAIAVIGPCGLPEP
jgi:tRNA(Arg) A34 adenosine deaminase TadA